MLARLLRCTVAFLSLSSVASAQTFTPHERKHPADAAELAAITERGRAIAAYDAAAWHATDAVLALHPPEGSTNMYIGRQTSAGWVVAFGKLNAAHDTFDLLYDVEPTGDILKPRVIVNTPALEEHGDWLSIARAFDLARSQLKVNRPYNGTVLAGPEGGWYVYFYPAQTTSDTFPTGADTRFLLSHDGTKILESHPMHASLLENKAPPKDAKDIMSFHTAFLDDAPEDTDVADVLMEGGIPMIITTRHFAYRIDADGAIHYLMPAKDFLKTMKH